MKELELNTPPYFEEFIEESLTIDLTEESVVTFTSPRAMDKQGDKILMKFEGLKDYAKAITNKNDTFTLTIDKDKVQNANENE